MSIVKAVLFSVIVNRPLRTVFFSRSVNDYSSLLQQWMVVPCLLFVFPKAAVFTESRYICSSVTAGIVQTQWLRFFLQFLLLLSFCGLVVVCVCYWASIHRLWPYRPRFSLVRLRFVSQFRSLAFRSQNRLYQKRRLQSRQRHSRLK